MPVYKIDGLSKEYVTPKHSTAFGSLVTGEQIELGVLRFRAGEGAHLPPNVPHSLAALEDAEVVSAKGIVGGVGHRS
jgi:hypothetical protein